MSRLFCKKSTSIAVIAAILILVLLVCMLLVMLIQISSLKARAEELSTLIEQAQHDEEKLQELKEYLKTDDYIREWAQEHDRLSQEEISWLKENT